MNTRPSQAVPTMATTEATPLVRQWMLLQSLAGRRYGLTINEMAHEAGVSTRTIRRDLLTLQDVGFPITENHVSSHGRRHWQLGTAGVGLNFTWDEAVALYLGRRLLDPLAGTVIWDSANKAFRKVRAILGETALRHLEKMSGAFHHTIRKPSPRTPTAPSSPNSNLATCMKSNRGSSASDRRPWCWNRRN